MAIERFGSRITLLGDAAFRERVLRTSKALKLCVSFVDRTQPRCVALTPNDAPLCLKPHYGIARHQINPGEEAARRYIAEREAKRALIVDIPRHALRTPGKGGSGRFAGWRQVDEQPLLLLKNLNAEITVMPVDMEALARVKRLRIGEEVFFNEDGMIRKRGLHL